MLGEMVNTQAHTHIQRHTNTHARAVILQNPCTHTSCVDFRIFPIRSIFFQKLIQLIRALSFVRWLTVMSFFFLLHLSFLVDMFVCILSGLNCFILTYAVSNILIYMCVCVCIYLPASMWHDYK